MPKWACTRWNAVPRERAVQPLAAMDGNNFIAMT